MDQPKIDIFTVVKQALDLPDKKPQMSTLSEYMIAFASEEDDELRTAVEYDLEKATYQGIVNKELIFIGADKQPIPLKEDEYKIRWVAVETTSILGSMLKHEYEFIIRAAENQLPEHLKGKVFVK